MNETFSPEYLAWVKSEECRRYFGDKPALTNNQHHFAEFLFQHANTIAQVGNMESVFISIRSYIKHQK